MYSVLKVNVRKCQYAPPIHIIITSNHNINCVLLHFPYFNHYYLSCNDCFKKIKNFIISINRLACIYKKNIVHQVHIKFQGVAKIKKKRPSRPKSTVNKTCDISKLYLKYFERQEKPIILL